MQVIQAHTSKSMEVSWCITAMDLAHFSRAVNATKHIHTNLCFATEFPHDLEKKILELSYAENYENENLSSLICFFLLEYEF